MIHFALNSQDVCVHVCVSLPVCVCVCVPECRLFEFVFVHSLIGNKHMKVQHNVFLGEQEPQ